MARGIARLFTALAAERANSLLGPYLDAVAACNASDRLTAYPGSPILVRAFLRTQDRLLACELEPTAGAALARILDRDRRCKAIAIDGWTALKAYISPKERRGLVLIDPPFEETSDFPRLAQALEAANCKWASGTYLLWYPLKDRRPADALAARLRRSRIGKILRAELRLTRARDPDRLNACGLLIINPPWMLEGELNTMLPELVAALSRGRGGHRVDWVAGEN